MEKAKLIVTKSKKGKDIITAEFTDGKTMHVPNRFKNCNVSELNNEEVDIERVGGQIAKIVWEDKTILDKSTFPAQPSVKQADDRKRRGDFSLREHKPAAAPYNFIPLNEKVIESDFNIDDTPFNTYHKNKNTGYIEVEIETKTPVYVRDTLNQKEQEEAEKGKQNPDFFSPAGRYRIPGSSLRGMVRNIVEIVSFGKFGFFKDILLFYRGLADKSKRFRKEYQDNMSSFDQKSRKQNYKMSAGVMYKKGLEYFIIPANFSPTQKTQGKRQYFKEISKNKFLVVSGDMMNKRHEWIVEYYPDNQKRINIDSIDIDEYLNDKLRDEQVINVVKETMKNGYVPCFYVSWIDKDGKKRISFGHTPFFRLAYKKTIGEHIKQMINNEENIDISTAIFGHEKEFASRVFFEDAYLSEDDYDKIIKEEQTPHILSSPKPTSFQLYLEQTTPNPNELKHYNDDVNIRGNKVYWHRSGNNYIQNNLKEINEHKSQYTKIKPVLPGAQFKGRIRFENLSDVELGALLLSLTLKDNLCHKIGMAKPLGLGSVKIKPTLFLSDREKRYKDLFFEFNDIPSSNKSDEKISAFEGYVLKELGSNSKSIWETERMKDLERMLDFDNKPDDKETSYMELIEFRERRVLPRPGEI